MAFHWDFVGCFILDLFGTSWRRTDGTSSVRPLETLSRYSNKTSWTCTTETPWWCSTDTSSGVSFETYLWRCWDVQRDVVTTSPQHLVGGWVPNLFYLFNFFFSEFSYIIIKNWQSCKEKLIFTIVCNISQHALNKFSKHMQPVIVAWTQICRQGKQQSLTLLYKTVCYSQNYLIYIRKQCKKIKYI